MATVYFYAIGVTVLENNEKISKMYKFDYQSSTLDFTISNICCGTDISILCSLYKYSYNTFECTISGTATFIDAKSVAEGNDFERNTAFCMATFKAPTVKDEYCIIECMYEA